QARPARPDGRASLDCRAACRRTQSLAAASLPLPARAGHSRHLPGAARRALRARAGRMVAPLRLAIPPRQEGADRRRATLAALVRPPLLPQDWAAFVRPRIRHERLRL